MRQIQVHLMGNLQVSCDGKPLPFAQNTAKKVAQLFLLLLLDPQDGVSRSTVQEALYRDSDADFASSYKSLVSRLRRSLSECTGIPGALCLTTQNGVLRLGQMFSVSSDVDEFERLHAEADTASGEHEQIARLSDALEAFGGELIPTLSSEPWVIYRNTQLQHLYYADAESLIEYYMRKKEYSSVIDVCSRAKAFFPYEEKWVIALIRALHALGKSSEAIQQYEQMCDLLYKKLGTFPSDDLKRVIIEADNDSPSDEDTLFTLEQALVNDLRQAGASYCSLPRFLDHLKILTRIGNRVGIRSTLAQLTLSDRFGKPLRDDEAIGLAMPILEKALSQSLRSSDLFTRSGSNRVLVLFWAMPSDRLDSVLARIRQHIARLDSDGVCLIRSETVIEGSPEL